MWFRLLWLFLLISIVAQSQHCQPDTKFLPSISFEGTAPIGAILQAGIFAQQSPFSIQAGCRIKEIHENSGNKIQSAGYKTIPRLELSYRALGDKDFGIHPYIGIATRPDIGVMVNLSSSDYSAFRFRFAYDGKFMVGGGAVFLIPGRTRD